MSTPVVMKFGGAALADGAAVRRVCAIVAEAQARHGTPPVVVVSAHAGVTDQLDELARAAVSGHLDPSPIRVRHRSLLSQLELPSDLLDRYWRALTALLTDVSTRGQVEPSELDRILSFGERLSARVVARALDTLGLEATPVDAWDLGLVTDSRHGRARPLEGSSDEIARALREVPGIPVVTGFLAKDARGRLTTLGRNGSDLSAAILAEASSASELVYWKTVPGILTADPRQVAEASLLPRVTYAEASELAFHGASVLHPDAVAPARRAKVPVRLASVLDPEAQGTILTEEAAAGGPIAVAGREEVMAVRMSIDSPGERAAATARLFGALESSGVTPLLVGAEDRAAWAVVEPGPEVPGAMGQLGGEASIERDLATVAVIGSGVGPDTALASRILAGFSAAGIEPARLSVSSSETSQTYLVRREDHRAATLALHELLLSKAQA